MQRCILQTKPEGASPLKSAAVSSDALAVGKGFSDGFVRLSDDLTEPDLNVSVKLPRSCGPDVRSRWVWSAGVRRAISENRPLDEAVNRCAQRTC
jgi:hypothetical protein